MMEPTPFLLACLFFPFVAPAVDQELCPTINGSAIGRLEVEATVGSSVGDIILTTCKNFLLGLMVANAYIFVVAKLNEE